MQYFRKTSDGSKRKSSSIVLVVAPQMRPFAKHVALKYHHLWVFVANGDIKIRHIDTQEHIIDIFANPLDPDLFGCLHYKLNVR